MTSERKDDHGKWTPETVIGAMRLAVEGAADETTALSMLRDLLPFAARTDPHDSGPVDLLVRRIKAGDYKLSVTAEGSQR